MTNSMKEKSISIARAGVLLALAWLIMPALRAERLTGSGQLSRPGTYEVVDKVTLSGDVTVSEGVTLLFTGGWFDADRKVTITGNSTAIQAADAMIFSKNISVEGKWLMPYASPLWFEPTVSNDHSSSINKAADMITKGIVRLPGGKYNIASPIMLPCGVTLEGASGNSSADSIGNGYNTKIVADPNGNWLRDANPSGAAFMVYVNADTSGNIKDEWPTQWLAMRNIYMNKVGIPELRGVYAVGGAGFDYMVWSGFRQALCYHKDYYSDNKRVTNCHFTNNGGEDENGISSADRNQYFLDMGFLGDGLEVSHCHFVNVGHPAIFVTTSGGGVISDNIVNGDVYISGCNAFTFSNNHLEGGAQVKVKGSTVEISNNYFEKGKVPSVDVSRGDDDYAVVSLRNNKYTVINRYRKEGDEGQNKLNRIDSICEYDVAIDTFTILNIDNEFRYDIVVGAHKTLPFGINILTPAGGLKAFNDKSYAFSRRSSVSYDYGVQGSARLDRINDVGVWHVQKVRSETWPSESVTWLRESGNYTYSYQTVPDPERGIYGLKNGVVTNKAADGMVLEMEKDKGGALLVLTGGDTNLKLYRTCVDDGTMESVTVPIAGSVMLYDNGVSVCGYKWQPVTGITEPATKTVYSSLQIDGDNVAAWCESLPSTFSGWKKGDVLYNVGSSGEWDIRIVR